MKNAIEHPSIAAAKRRVEPEITWRFTPQLPPGEYRAYCRSAKIYWDGSFHRWVCAVQFDVLTDDLQEILGRVTWFMNLGDKREKPNATRRSNYFNAWTRAKGGLPSRKDRVSTNVFTRRYARVLVGNTAKDFKQSAVDEQMAYSVIREVLSWDTGEREQ